MRHRIAIATALFLGFGGAAQADILKAVTLGEIAGGGARALVPLTSSATSISFTVAGLRSKKIAITYSATCGAGGALGGMVDIDIVVDGTEIAPTNTTGEQFCSSDETTAIDTLTRATIIGVKTLAPGQHTVQVYAEAMGGATSFEVGFSTLLIQD